MAKKRRLSNPLALAVLVLLSERPMHPYEIAATLRARHKEESIKIRYGSLYKVIELLQKEGLIVAREKAREGRRPERTVYELTSSGRTEMREWLSELVSEPAKEYLMFEAGLCLLPALEPEEAVSLLETREHRLDQKCRQVRGRLDTALKLGIPPLFVVEAEYRLAQLESERQFVHSLVLRIKEEEWSAEWSEFHNRVTHDDSGPRNQENPGDDQV
jgi:DNA-binding PadR family transcriptional regulator